MIANDTQLRQVQENIQTIWRFWKLRERHTRRSLPLQLQERQQEVVAYLSRRTSSPDADSA